MNRFNSITKPLTWFMALLLTAFVAGCGGGSSGIAAGTAAPATVTSIAVTTSIGVTPTTASIPVAGTQKFVATAKYSDSTTSDVTTTATWASSNNTVAAFNTTAGVATGVAPGTVNITAAIGGVTSSPAAVLTVTAVAAGPVVCTGAGCVDLGTAANYVILTKAGVSTIPTSVVTGDIGVSPIDSTAITGFGTLPLDPTTLCFSTSPQVTGKLYAADYSSVNGCATATTDTATLLTAAVGTGNPAGMEAAYNNANLLAPAGGGDTATGGVACPGLTGPGVTAGAFGGMTITPGVYTCTVTIDIATATNVTLSGAGVYVFRTSQGITQASGTQVLLTNGALAQNVFWVPALAVAITGTAGTTTTMAGVILAKTNIAVGTNATVNGRLLAQGAVSLDAATITQP